MNQDLVKYIEENIYPLYERNDWAHQLWHIKGVVERSLKLAKDYPVNLDMVYVIASFHDLGCFVSRDNHEEVSSHLMEQDTFVQKYFTKEEIRIMKEAIIDHRGSLEYVPRSIYGKIISSGDRFVTIEGIMRSVHSYSLEFYSDLTWKEMVERCYQYIEKKYGKDGYAKSYIENEDYENFLIEVQRYLDDCDLFTSKLKEVDTFLRKEYRIGNLSRIKIPLDSK